MQGMNLNRRSNLGTTELSHLRKSVIWSSPVNPTIRRGALQERLEELLVLELHKDGGRSYLTFTVRDLYKYVLAAITSKISGRRERDEVNLMIQKKNSGIRTGGARKMGEIVNAPVVLGGLTSHKEGESEYDDEEGTAASGPQEHSESLSGLPEIPSPRPQVDRLTSFVIRGRKPVNAETATYRERLGGYLHPRDMRRLVTPFSASNEPGLIVRRHVMLLNFDPMRAVILRDRLLVIVPDGADSILVQLEKRVRGGILEMERSFLGGTAHGNGSDDEMAQSGHSIGGMLRRVKKMSSHASSNNNNNSNSNSNNNNETANHKANLAPSPQTSGVYSEAETASTQGAEEFADTTDNDDEWNDLQGTEWIDLPFELQCTDAVLHTVSNFLAGDTMELQDAAAEYIQRILDDKSGPRDDPLTIIRAVKEAVREMSGRVKGFVQSINTILDEDEDMALMNLTRLQTHPERFMYPVTAEILEEESDEPELILESYLQEGLSLINILSSIQGQIDTAAELVDQRLDSVRNRILMANMILTAVSLAITAAAAVGSFFGMNVPIPYEEDDTAFRKIVFGTLAGALGISVFILLSLFHSGTMPNMRLRG